MKIEVNKYRIELSEETNYKKNSIDNLFKFENHYFDENECTTKVGIKVFEEGSLLSSAIIGANGGAIGIYENTQIVSEKRIVICCSDTVFNLLIPSLDLFWMTKADRATCFEIFELEEDFIVHGEVEISRISKTGEIVWQRSGRDVFTTIERKNNDFKMTDKYILAADWENRKYKFDFEGNEVEE